ncbi:MAG: hypothetical protein MZV64_71370 [Ignavibacteriales bacterium]|nr:hypothetical protein [Ignavibacteriales bacterium]
MAPGFSSRSSASPTTRSRQAGASWTDPIYSSRLRDSSRQKPGGDHDGPWPSSGRAATSGCPVTRRSRWGRDERDNDALMGLAGASDSPCCASTVGSGAR